MGQISSEESVHCGKCVDLSELVVQQQQFGQHSDDINEDGTRSHSVASEKSDSHEECEDFLITASTTEKPTLTTPTAIESKLSSEVMKMLQFAKMNSSNSDIEKAIEYGTWLQEWLNNCSIPLLTRRQIFEHKYILDALKWFKNSPSTAQQGKSSSRKFYGTSRTTRRRKASVMQKNIASYHPPVES